jgi:hypothetical protein
MALMAEQCFGGYVEPREGESESAVDCLMMIATLRWMLLTIVFIGKDKMNWGRVKSSTHIQCR